MDTTIERLHAALRNRLGDAAQLLGHIDGPQHPAGWPALWVNLPSGHRARIEDIDAWGVIVEDRDGDPWRGLSFTGDTGDDYLTGADRLEQVVDAAEAAVRTLVALDAEGRLDEFGVNIA